MFIIVYTLMAEQSMDLFKILRNSASYSKANELFHRKIGGKERERKWDRARKEKPKLKI